MATINVLRKASISMFFILIFNVNFGQSAKEQLKIANAAELQSKHFLDSVAFENRLGYFIIKVQVKQKTYDYIFDTGGYNTANKAILSKENIQKKLQVEVGSSNQKKSKIDLLLLPELKIGSTVFKDIGVFNFNFDESPLINCFTNGGLVGKGIIKEAIWQIDSKRSVIRITDQIDRLSNSKGGKKIKIEWDKTYNPFVTLTINGIDEKFLLDFGYGGFISLTDKTFKKLNLDPIKIITGEGSIGANGVIKEETKVSRINKTEIAGFIFDKIPVYSALSNNYNLIGSELSKYFIITIDSKANEMILTPYTDQLVIEQPRQFGFDINLKNKKLYVSKLYQNMSAEKEGLQFDDVLISYNGTQLNEEITCDEFFKLKEILKSTDNIKVEISRNGLIKSFNLVKENI
ncbi:aspartyl protease family protein [Chryseobacterium paridis]|uniref:Aspartyl protease family protein n=1 Tax=Chryseobacterium paridis TaxID=2800328 RepID=A0ABS1FV39_9FLAO|nr:aspartyl protease family protein [Chryseobacterium paridis]MBK1896272.1 aspartyl protease family protein [Chryseobacterium paridis]